MLQRCINIERHWKYYWSVLVKTKTFLIALIPSVLLNVIGAIFFIGYLNLLGHSKRDSMERAQLASSLTFAQTANIVSQLATPDRVEKRAFLSSFDGSEDFVAIAPVALITHTKDVTLFVFLHGMGQTAMEPFVMPKNSPLSDYLLARNKSYVLMAPNYRAPSAWASDAVMSDITQNIHMMCDQYPVKHIVLIGSSMGGCVSLSYCALAPKDIKEKLIGVVAVEAAGDYAELYRKSKLYSVRPTMDECFGGPPERATMGYAAKSLLSNMSSVPGQLRLALVSARQDKTVPPELQDQVFNAFHSQGRPVKLIPVEMDHGWPSLNIVSQALDFVLSDDSAKN